MDGWWGKIQNFGRRSICPWRSPIRDSSRSSLTPPSTRGLLRTSEVASISSVVGSNFCEIGLERVGANTVVVMSTLDNLVKGASGQAIQNANIMLGLPEEAGLNFPGLGV